VVEVQEMKPHTACMNKKRKDGYSVLVRKYVPSGEYHFEPHWIEDRSSVGCRSDFDPLKTGACKGCEYPQDVGFLKEKKIL
jgi:hypothetical protein